MNLSKFHSSVVAVVLFGYLAISTTLAHAGLTGETIDASGNTLGPASATIGPGVEFIGINGFINFDFSDSTLTLTSSGYGLGWFMFGSYTFSGFTDTITGLSIGPNDGFSGDLFSNYTFTDHSITLDMGTGGAQTTDSFLVFNIDSSGNSIPDQSSTVGLCGVALAGIGLIRRRR